MKTLFALLLLFLPSAGFCDSKISELTSTTTLNSADIIPVVTNPGSLPSNRKITFLNLSNAIAYPRSGFSSRLGQAVTVNTAVAALDALFGFSYQAPGITLSASGASFTNEFGTSLANISLSATTVEKSSPILTVSFFRGNSDINDVGSPSSTGGTENYTDTFHSTFTISYTAKAGDGTTTTTSNSQTFTFVYPFFYGVGAQHLSFAQVQALNKVVQVKANTATTTSPSGQVYYFAYPQSYGSLTSILDQNGFETIGGYTQRSGTMTMLDATVQNYYVYEFNNPTTQTNFTNTYKF